MRHRAVGIEQTMAPESPLRGAASSALLCASVAPWQNSPVSRLRDRQGILVILLRLISWPYFRRHVLRTLLTIAGIVLGVAVFVGMHTANQSVLAAFSQTVDRIAGKAELQVTAGEIGFDEDILENVQAASSVRVAVPVVEAV